MRLFHGLEPWLLDDPPITVPSARPRACLFVHGLMGSERAWRFGMSSSDNTNPSADSVSSVDSENPGNPDPRRVDYAAVLAEARDCTPIYVRYNSGRHISENGRALAEQIEQLRLAWPGDGFAELSIVSHSMGGLVTRSACHYGLEAGHGWVDRLQRVFLLGVPSRGAPLEQLAHLTAFTLETIWNPWTKVIGKLINLRSAGIKDLRHGFVLDEDWRHVDLDRLAFPIPVKPRDPLHVRWYIAAGTLGAPKSALARTIGDGLVRSSSAQGRSHDPRAREVLPPAEVREFECTSHIELMNNPAVLAQMLEWWSPVV
jgi:pimeloyl-ACP methyl ester carboxylesterase